MLNVLPASMVWPGSTTTNCNTCAALYEDQGWRPSRGQLADLIGSIQPALAEPHDRALPVGAAERNHGVYVQLQRVQHDRIHALCKRRQTVVSILAGTT